MASQLVPGAPLPLLVGSSPLPLTFHCSSFWDRAESKVGCVLRSRCIGERAGRQPGPSPPPTLSAAAFWESGED